MNNIYLKIHLDDTENNTSSQPEMFYKNRCSEKFRKIHRKSFEPCLRSSTLLKKRGIWHRFFLVNFSKFMLYVKECIGKKQGLYISNLCTLLEIPYINNLLT